MSKSAVAPQHSSEAPAAPAIYPDDLEPQLQATLSGLASLESYYEQERGSLEHWPGPETIKERLARELEERHRQAREPYVQRLADLHTRITALTMFRGLRTRH